MSENETRMFAEIDVALRTWPLSHAPASLAPAVMARIRNSARTQVRFALLWLDFAFPLFATLMFAVAFALWFNLPAQQVAYLTAQMKWLWLLFAHQLLWLSLSTATLFAGAMAVAALFAVLLVLREPRFSVSR